ncbi:hypothetical protein F4818DRAFT_437776 [Hypoxylon cercidicola]|nr:hypothetical protein F4818DRAFT_437776 [Hypoxylon cercidicola]
MKATLIRGFVSSLALWECHAAVTWTTIGCESWTFDGTSIDAIWAKNAQSQIDAVPTGPIPIGENERRARANVNFMFDVGSSITGIDSAGKQALQNAKTMYANIERGLIGTLTGVDVDNAFLFCEDKGLKENDFPGSSGAKIWHAEVVNGGVIKYIVPAYASFASSERPCHETQLPKYEAKTFTATQYINEQPSSFVGIILCPERYKENKITVVPTLDQGFTATPSNGNKFASPNDYISLVGTLVHEMVHVVGRSQGTTYTDQAYAFNKCFELGKSNQAAALINPENYRVFAEMSMSPKTKWGPKNPKENS